MLDLDFAVLEAHPEWRQVLLAYGDDIDVTTTADAETSEFLARGFRPRVREVDGVPADQMARVHGKLIAHGLLQVEIAGRTGGMLYQLTTVGRRACLQVAEESLEPALA
ncbi:MAG: hypothetical protein IAG10_19055 [Planctomycetaceae bacterium]|nr:hypothetical protein [Planctomycetaceae bacterium]